MLFPIVPKLRSVALAASLALAAIAVTAAPASALDVQKITSPGGIKAWLVVDRTTPIITVSFAFRGASVRDPKGKEGVAKMVAGLLDQGAGDLDAQALQSKLEDLSIRFSVNAGRDSFTGSLRTLGERRDEAIRLFAMMLTKPRFDPAAVARVRRQMISAAVRSAKRPNSIASRSWMARAFPNHSYGRPSGGTPDTLAAITEADLRSFVRGTFARDNLVVGVVGNVDPEEVGPWLDRMFGGLPAKSAPLEVKKIAPKLDGEIHVVPFEVPQSRIVFGQTGLPRDDEDFYAAYLMNHILGRGSFTSRLYQEVREKRGLAYGIYTYLMPLDYAALYFGVTATTNAAVTETIRLVRQQWELMAENGVAAEELAAAKKHLTGAYPLRFAEAKDLASMLVSVQMDNLGADYFDKRNSYIEAVTVDDIRRVAKRLLHEKQLTFVVVGAPKGL